MKHPFRCNILPYFTLGAGLLGLALRFWLFSATDEKGLLPAAHPANHMLYILTAVTLAVLFLATRSLKPRKLTKGFFQLSGVFGYLLGGLGLLAAAILLITTGSVRMSRIATVACLLGSLAMVFMALLRHLRKKPPYWLHAILAAALMLNTVTQCQVWGAEPQLQVYFFPLMASVFLILTAYHATTFAAGRSKPRHLAFFSQGAMFLCFLSLNADQWPLYLGLIFWAGSLFYPAIFAKKEA